MTNNKNRFLPLILALCLVAGIGIGTFYANHFSGNKLDLLPHYTFGQMWLLLRDLHLCQGQNHQLY